MTQQRIFTLLQQIEYGGVRPLKTEDPNVVEMIEYFIRQYPTQGIALSYDKKKIYRITSAEAYKAEVWAWCKRLPVPYRGAIKEAADSKLVQNICSYIAAYPLSGLEFSPDYKYLSKIDLSKYFDERFLMKNNA